MQAGEQLQMERVEIVVNADGIVVDVRADGPTQRLVDGLVSGDRVGDRVHPDDQDLIEYLSNRVLRDRRVATAALRWSRSSDRWSKFTTTFAPNGNDVCITVGYEETAGLRRAEEQLRRVVEGSAQGIVVRTRGQILYMNESFAKLLGFASVRECMDNRGEVNDGIHPDDLPIVLKHMEARIRGNEVVSNYEFRLVRRDRKTIWVEVHASNVNWDGKSASLSWMSDISRRKAIEEESRRSREAAEFANRTKTQFLANMSHELRTPLNAILGFSEVIQREMFGPVAEKYLGYAGDIHRSGRHLLELVNDVLDLSKLEAGKLELHESELSVVDLAEDCIALLRSRAQEGRLRLVCDVPQALPLLKADPRAVKQLLLNFLSNAIKFTPEEGEVRLQARLDPRERLVLSVSDTGIGMTHSEIEVALSAFGQVDSNLARRHEGTGLGLPICRSLIELHGGEMIVESAPNVGTTLAAHFPASRTVRRDAARAS
jgi:PAS domain S-box-containing protein